jgi:hypothetical protein
MPNYTIRVELKGNPTYLEYQRLHAAMSKLGFNQTIGGTTTTGQTATWNLPHALYYGFSNGNVGDVRDISVQVARNIQSGVVVFVAQTENWAIGNYD